ncbi:MAG: hypothetical protein Q8M51_02885 [Polaromonas sp.]|uniref:hypothetical protein n=1 Tax=Polaromonas sp. TaxID=1869339 RepID=UPI00273094BA|nr:hypothetical protein [Polaromonas sp.]MDP1741634.1 hypothetical protein [Polaromonas sp.]MDP3354797.1 hypothetical protein [Polaromonas sp.]MDP3752871.1 hypothetical protein [Polaromonas sp.]
MTNFRFIPLAIALTAATTLVACNTAPSMPMPMAMAATPGTAPPDHLAHMDTQIKSMQAMHDKMMSAKTPEERNKLMAEHMKSMQDGMKMMEGMAGAGMGDMKGKGDMKGMTGMTGDMGARHQMMEKRMEMMQTMMKMMMDRMPAAPAR